MRDLRTIFLPRHFLCLMEAMTAVGPTLSQQAAVAPTDTTTLHVASRLVGARCGGARPQWQVRVEP
jgi:hypothetical protein